jgi:hypothetical protein
MRYSGIPSDYQPLVVDNYYNVYVVGRDSLEAAITIKYSQLIGIKPLGQNVPDRFLLYQNYPNPFNPNTLIKYQISKSCFVKLTVYDLLGREISRLVDKKQNAGFYEVNWDAGNFSSGVYFYSLEADTYKETKKMMIIK